MLADKILQSNPFTVVNFDFLRFFLTQNSDSELIHFIESAFFAVTGLDILGTL